MRWDNLFQDLENQLEQELEYAQSDIARDRARYESSQRSWLPQVRAILTAAARDGGCRCFVGDRALWITVDNCGKDWASGTLTDPMVHSGYIILNLDVVERIAFIPTADPPQTESLPPNATPRLSLTEKITLRIVLRDLARRRKTLTVVTANVELHGTIDQVGSDYLVVAEHSATQSRRPPEVKNLVFLRLSAVLWVRLDD